MNNNIDVSVVLVNYKTVDLTLDAVRSVFLKTTGVNFEIVIVDNGSFDGSVPQFKIELAEYGDKVTVVESTENLGFGKGNNLGFMASKGKYIFCLNTDTILINNAVKILFDFMEGHKNCGACGGSLFDVHGTFDTKSVVPFPKKFAINDKGEIVPIFGMFNKPLKSRPAGNKKVDSLNGADLMIRKSVVDRVGMFDPDFFLYCEDGELCNRIKKGGFGVWFVRDAEIRHFKHGSSADRESTRPYFIDSQNIFIKKVYGEKVYNDLIASQRHQNSQKS
jgi:GT2 family glycosyltransferase